MAAPETLRSYKIEVPPQGILRFNTQPQPIDMIITGSFDSSADENQSVFGQYISEQVAQAIDAARLDGNVLVLDAATGSSPKSAWDALGAMNTDLSNVVVIGHEEAWGQNPESSFDYAKKKLLAQTNLVPITSIHQITNEVIDGNFVPMHLKEVKREDFPEGNDGDLLYVEAEEQAAMESAHIYNGIVRALLRRYDVDSIGVYGIGTDGHIGEWQRQDMGLRRAVEKIDAFVQPQQSYSIEAGYFPLPEDTDGKLNNVYWKRGTKIGKAFGRATRQQGYNDQHVVVGLGLREMLRLDHVILSFNNDTKHAAFTLAMEGTITGIMQNSTGKEVVQLQRDSGEGEAIRTDLATYARTLEAQGLLAENTVDTIENSKEKLKCGLLYQIIYKALDNQEASADNPIYAKMGEFTNRYVGKRSPLGQFIRMRSLLGKKTTIVATPEVIKETQYAFLATL